MKITFNTTLLAAAVLVAGLMLFVLFRHPGTVDAAGYNANVISSATTSAAFSVTSSTRVLATTTNAIGNGTSFTRIYATICNPSSNPVYLNLNVDNPATTNHATAVIAAAAGFNACFEITDRNQYSGSIQASSTNQTATSVLVTEYVQ